MKKEIIKNIELMEELEREQETIKKEQETTKNKIHEFYNNFNKLHTWDERSEEEKKFINELKEEEEKTQCKKSVIEYSKSLIKNNLDLIFNKIIKEELFTILHNYDDKKIGEKTKEKIKEEIKNYMLNNYNITCYFSFYKEYDFSNDYKITFDFYKRDTYIKYSDITFYKNIDTKKIGYYFKSLNYNYIKVSEIKKVAEKILIDRRKKQQQIEKLQKQLETIKKDFNGKYCINNTTYIRL